MKLTVCETALHVLNLRARMPFRYGIATLTALPHLMAAVTLEVDGRRERGISADGLPPKWFTKNPQAPFRQEVAEMLAVVRAACRFATEAGPAASPFALWREILAAQQAWAAATPCPPLLWSFGVSLVERAVLDAFCRANRTPFAEAVWLNLPGVQPGEIHPQLEGYTPAHFLPPYPLRSVAARHTVGLSDPLTDGEIPPDERLDDGLPQSLEACIRAYGLTHFKVKLGGDAGRDLVRLRALARVIEENVASGFTFTLDGNEQFRAVEPFRALWEALHADATLAPFLHRLLFVEQPFPRDAALSEETGRALQAWTRRPPIVIDESDGALDSLRLALARGYAGTSHKNCKGVFKGIANACLIEHHRRARPQQIHLLSGEDLANVGPIALLQDLAAMATLGIAHVERNGHHYFRGLSMWPAEVREAVLAAHGDLYRRHPRGFPTLHIHEGRIELDSVVEAPFGLGLDLDPARFTPLEAWDFDSLESGGAAG